MVNGIARFLVLLGWLFVAGGCSARSADQLPSEPIDPAELEHLVAPIALYPDPLLQRVLTAATFPDQIIDAAIFLEKGGEPRDIPGKSWERSVKYVANYPSVLVALADDLDHTIELGTAFTTRPDEVRSWIQTLRRRARERGNLVSTAHQTVIEESGGGATTIRIEPTDPNLIYIPTTSTTVIYEKSVDDAAVWVPLATFGLGVALASALDDDDHYYYGGPFYGPGFWYGGPIYRRWYDYRRERWPGAYDYSRHHHHHGSRDGYAWERHRHELARRQGEWRNAHRSAVEGHRQHPGPHAGRASFRPHRSGTDHSTGRGGSWSVGSRAGSGTHSPRSHPHSGPAGGRAGHHGGRGGRR